MCGMSVYLIEWAIDVIELNTNSRPYLARLAIDVGSFSTSLAKVGGGGLGSVATMKVSGDIHSRQLSFDI